MTIQLVTESGKKIALEDKHHIQTGGEGSVYFKDNAIYKIYTDQNLAIKHGIDKKFELLKKLQHPHVAAPVDMLFDKKGLFAGLVLPKMEGDAICKLFTTTWQTTNRFDSKNTAGLVSKMQDIVNFAHNNNALIVDGNEFNWLATKNDVSIIDVDSWQLPGFNATAIMTSIKDHHHLNFTKESDWFAWAIVSFQLWTGIHPFKGMHKDFKPSDLVGRMTKNVSVFNSEVSVPKAARSFDLIPSNLRNWYEEIFSTTKRSTPPSQYTTVLSAPNSLSAKRIIQTSSSNLAIDLIFKGPGIIVGAINGYLIIQNGKVLSLFNPNTRKEETWLNSEEIEELLRSKAGLLTQEGEYYYIRQNKGILTIKAKSGQVGQVTSYCKKIIQNSDQVLFETNEGFCTMKLVLSNNTVLGQLRNPLRINKNSANFYKKICLDYLLGGVFVTFLEEDQMMPRLCPELFDYRVVNAAYCGSNSCYIYAVDKKDGLLYKLKFRVSSTNSTALELIERVITEEDLNSALLKSDVYVLLSDTDLVAEKGSMSKKMSFKEDLLLASFDNSRKILGFTPTEAYHLSLK